MTKENENSGSENGENLDENENLDEAALKERNRQLFARAKKAESEFKEYKTKYPVKDETANKPPDAKPPKQQDDLDYGQMAYLRSSGIQGSDEVALVKEIISNTGKSLLDVIDSKYFQAELKELRDNKAAKNAMPDSTKRGSNNNQGDADYWTNAYLQGNKTLKDVPQEFQEKALAAREKAEKSKSEFSDEPMITNF